MDNPIYVMMPVLCVGKMCKNCPNIKVDTDLSEFVVNNDRTFEANLRCRSVNKCLRIKQMMEEYYDKHTKRTDDNH